MGGSRLPCEACYLLPGGRGWLAGGAEPVGKCGVAAACSAGADGLGEGAPGSGEDDQSFGAGDPGVEQVALQHRQEEW